MTDSRRICRLVAQASSTPSRPLAVSSQNPEATVESKRIQWIDACKLISIAAVILGHTYSIGKPIHALTYSFHIPLFFVLAGYTFRAKPWRALVGTSLRRLGVPYVALVVMALVTGVTRGWVSSWAQLGSQFLAALFAAGGTVVPFGIPAIGIAWFLACLLMTRLLLNAVVRLTGEREALGLVVCCACAVVGRQLGTRLFLPLALDQSLVALLFMYVGWLVRRRSLVKALGRPVPLVLLALVWLVPVRLGVFFSIGNLYFTRFVPGLVMTLAGSLFIMAASARAEAGPVGRLLAPLAALGRDSLALLVIHQFELSLIDWGPVVERFGALAGAGAGVLHLLVVGSLYAALRTASGRVASRSGRG